MDVGYVGESAVEVGLHAVHHHHLTAVGPHADGRAFRIAVAPQLLDAVEKLAERRGEGRLKEEEIPALIGAEIGDDLWELVLQCARRCEVVSQAVSNLEFSLLAQHVHELAQLFHRLYHTHPVVPEENEEMRRLRRAVFTLFDSEMKVLLEQLLGIPIPAEM